MMYLVKHGQKDYRLHKRDGSEIETWSWDNDWLDNRTESMLISVRDAVGDSGWHYRDLTIDDETVPWQ